MQQKELFGGNEWNRLECKLVEAPTEGLAPPCREGEKASDHYASQMTVAARTLS